MQEYTHRGIDMRWGEEDFHATRHCENVELEEAVTMQDHNLLQFASPKAVWSLTRAGILPCWVLRQAPFGFTKQAWNV